MKILLTILALSIATLIASILVEEVDPGNDSMAAAGGLAIITTFISGVLVALGLIWSLT